MAEGDISAVVDSLVFDAVYGSYGVIIHVTGEIYAIAYAGSGNIGKLITVSIDSSGNISAAPIDTVIFDAASGAKPSIVHVYGTIFAIAYIGPDTDGWICTVGINADGSIDDAVKDTLEFCTSYSECPQLIHLSGAVYAVVDRSTNFEAWIYTFTITDAGAISDAVLDSLKFGAWDSAAPQILRMNSAVCAAVYQDATDDGQLVTLPVNDAGAIGDAVIDSYEFETTYAASPHILHVSGNVYLISYMDTSQDGYIFTVTISPAGLITKTPIDSYEFNPVCAYSNVLVHVSGNVYMILYTEANNDLFACTVTVALDGTITKSLISSLEIETVDGQFPSCVYCGNNIYAVVYTFTGSTGKIATFGCVTIPPGFQKHLMLMGID